LAEADLEPALSGFDLRAAVDFSYLILEAGRMR
jgi:hypothetical protein